MTINRARERIGAGWNDSDKPAIGPGTSFIVELASAIRRGHRTRRSANSLLSAIWRNQR